MSLLSLVEFVAKMLLIFIFGLFGYAKLSPNIDSDHHRDLSNMFRSSYTPIWQDFLQKNLGISYAVMPLNAALFQSVVGWSELIVCLLFSISIVCDIIGFYSVTFIAASLATALMIGATYTDYLRYCNCVDKSLVGIDECKFEQMSSILLGINIFLVLMKIPLKSKRKTN